MADIKKDKFGELKELLNFFDKASRNISESQIADFKKMRLNALEAENEREKYIKTRIYEEIAELEAKGRLKSEEDSAKFAKKRVEEQYKYKLESEISILKEISQEEEKERSRQIEILEKEKEIIQFKNKNQKDEAKKAEQELKQLQKKQKLEKLKEQGQDYKFGENIKGLFSSLKDGIEEQKAQGNAFKRAGEEALVNSLKSVGKAITEGMNVINRTISDYAKYQTAINARLQGKTTFGELVDKLDVVAFSPLISASDLYYNLNQLVGQGIVTNVEQRAFFATIKDGIATTFDTSSDSLNRIIRIQRNDSTAARLGMESYLTKFLNYYVENTEYLQTTFDNVASSLLEASAVLGQLKGVGASLEFEYVVQKWLGTLTGIGLANETAQNIANALGKLGAGDVDVLNSNMGTLLTMSASSIGKNIGDILNNGLDSDTTNKLLTSMVNYLQTIASNGTNVTKAELAKIFGVSISDLVAVAKMDQSAIKTINDELLSYTGMYTQLRDQFNQLPSRMGISNILENLFSNLTYQTGMSIASNPASYALWKITDMIQGVTGGINIPSITAFGTGIDLNTTVENLMKIGLVGFNMLGNIGNIINGMSSIGKGDILLDKLKINMGSSQLKTFGGEGLNLGANNFRNSGSNTSQTTYIGQESSDAFYDSTISKERSKSESDIEKRKGEEEAKDPVVKYFSTTLDLKTKLEAITLAGNQRYDILTKISSESISITKVLSQINTNILEKILPAINQVNSLSYGSKLFDKTTVTPLFSSENTLVNTNLTNVSTVSAASPVAEYFDKISFVDGFQSIVKNISEINEKITPNINIGNTAIEGFASSSRRT